MQFSVEMLRKACPAGNGALLQAVVDGWSRMKEAGITANRLRLCHFLTQIATETGGFTIFDENMNYSAERMCQVWPSRFHSVEAARPFAHNPEKLANNVYGGRMGNVDPGDGWKYHGRGFMQTTGRDNYTRIGHAADPERLADPLVALDAAVEEWSHGALNAVADRDNIISIRRVINGGVIGIERAKVLLDRFKAAIPDDLDMPADSPAPKPSLDEKGFIMAIQTKLKILGLYDGNIDGDQGQMTNAALQRYAIDTLSKGANP